MIFEPAQGGRRPPLGTIATWDSRIGINIGDTGMTIMPLADLVYLNMCLLIPQFMRRLVLFRYQEPRP